MFRNINEKFSDNSTHKLSSFTRKDNTTGNREETKKQEEDNGEFRAEDIDEELTPGSIPVPKFKQIHLPFRQTEDCKHQSRANAAGNRTQMSYLKSIATPMQSRRPIRPQQPAAASDSKGGSYFRRLGENGAGTNPEPQLVKDGSEYHTALSHFDSSSPGSEDKKSRGSPSPNKPGAEVGRLRILLKEQK